MAKDSSDKELKEEYTQIYVRYFIYISIAFCIFFISPALFNKSFENFISLKEVFLIGLLSNSIYYIVLKFFSSFLSGFRIYIQSFIDVFIISVAIIISGAYSAYFPAVLLWYIVGYSSRYDINVSVFVTINTFIAWVCIIYYSDYWAYHLDIAMGWLLAFIILPLYFLKVLYKLNKKYHTLFQDFNDTQEEAKYDFLTGLINRSYFEKMLDTFIDRSLESDNSFTLMFIDLDGFKKVNDLLGHDIGDEILIEVANRLKVVEKKGDITARLGGDEFTLIIPHIKKEIIKKRAEDIVAILSQPYSNNIQYLSASIGIAMFPKDTSTKTLLKKYADIAMYKAKKEGKNRFVFFYDIQKI